MPLPAVALPVNVTAAVIAPFFCSRHRGGFFFPSFFRIFWLKYAKQCVSLSPQHHQLFSRSLKPDMLAVALFTPCDFTPSSPLRISFPLSHRMYCVFKMVIESN